jgi:hypothetical protein
MQTVGYAGSQLAERVVALAVGVGVAVLEGLGVIVGDGDCVAVTVIVGDGVWVEVGEGVTVGVGVAVKVTVGVTVGDGVAVKKTAITASKTPALPAFPSTDARPTTTPAVNSSSPASAATPQRKSRLG